MTERLPGPKNGKTTVNYEYVLLYISGTCIIPGIIYQVTRTWDSRSVRMPVFYTAMQHTTKQQARRLRTHEL